jgi:hypothetical protein
MTSRKRHRPAPNPSELARSPRREEPLTPRPDGGCTSGAATGSGRQTKAVVTCKKCEIHGRTCPSTHPTDLLSERLIS